MCWRQLRDVGDRSCRLCHQRPLFFNIGVGHQHSKDATNIEILSPTFTNCRQNKATNNFNRKTRQLRLFVNFII